MNPYRKIALDVMALWQAHLESINDNVPEADTIDALERTRLETTKIIRQGLGGRCDDCGSQPHMSSRYY